MDVVVASVEKTLQVVASQKTKFVADKSIGEASKSVYDLIVLPVSLAIVINQFFLSVFILNRQNIILRVCHETWLLTFFSVFSYALEWLFRCAPLSQLLTVFINIAGWIYWN